MENWFWPTLRKDAEKFCASCDDCAKSKAPARYTKMPLERLQPTAFKFGDRLHIDLLSMPTSTDGNVAICTAVDAATGFVFALACPDKTSRCVSRLLLETIIPYFGPPKHIVTDLGVENMNSEISKLLKHYHIEHITSSRAHPQSNGLVERRQRMLLNYARLFTNDYASQNSWDIRLPMCLLILNSTKTCLLYTSDAADE